MMRHSWTPSISALVGLGLVGAASFGQSILWDRAGPPALQGQLGSALWTLSDVDGDGVKDLLVGAPFFASYVGILSGATGNTLAEMFAPPGENLRPIGTVGDTTGDGMIDFLVVHVPPGQTYPVATLISGSDASVVNTPT